MERLKRERREHRTRKESGERHGTQTRDDIIKKENTENRENQEDELRKKKIRK